jgi:hypothetical protein
VQRDVEVSQKDPTDPFKWLVNWYVSQCDGEWEHDYGITLGTLDNPGWELRIDLAETDLAARPFEQVGRGDSETDESWIMCWVADDQFRAACGALDLNQAVSVFRSWAEENSPAG